MKQGADAYSQTVSRELLVTVKQLLRDEGGGMVTNHDVNNKQQWRVSTVFQN